MATTLNVRLVTRNDTAENWANSTGILAAGELGLDTTNNILKAGDGEHVWSELEPVGGVTASHYEGIASAGETDASVISRILNENNASAEKDDVFIVKHTISEGNYSHTAYVYNGTAWAAMDGNYNAENVYFDEDMLFTYEFGKYKLSNGNVTIPSAGKNLKELLMGAHVDIVDPTKTNPGFSISASSNITQEVGTSYSLPTATATFTDGKYSYGYVDADGNKVSGTNTSAGIVASEIKITCDQSSDSVTVNSANSGKLTLTTANLTNADYKDLLVADESISYKFSATCSYPASTRTPTNNVGETSNSETGTVYTPIGSGSFAAKTSTCTVSGWRGFFYGALKVAPSTTAVTSEMIRGLTAGGNYNAKKTFTIKANGASDLKAFVVAIPASSTRSGITNVDSTAGMTVSMTSSYVEAENTVAVADARGTVDGVDQNTVAYKLYVWEPASIDAATVHEFTLG